jgi:bacteriocin-type transport-associated protein
MTEVLLKELNNSDLSWMNATGNLQEVSAGTVLLQAGKPIDTLHIVIEGTLGVLVSQVEDNPLSRAFTALEGEKASSQEITRLSIGEVVGESCFISDRPPTTTVKALEKSLVLSLPQQQLATKLQQDVGFAYRFTRAIAILLLDRLQNLVGQLERRKLVQSGPIRDVLYVLGELNDSDIDWLIATGSRQKIAPNMQLIREGGPVDALYIILAGTMALSVSEGERNPLARAFAALDSGETPNREIAKLSKGEIIGETYFIDVRLPFATVKALEESLLLSIPRQQLVAKLQQDVGFAFRFYRMSATLLSNRLQEMMGRIGYGRRVYSKGQSLNENTKYEDELDSRVLENMALAGTRFDWMLKRLRG